eukprot:scaffold716_cov364-Pinguiococcus_pyrenoidosus.AAC.9
MLQGGTDGTWTYPSPQMFYNAIVRKGKKGSTSEDDMETVVAIHNNMNERTWDQVMAWEKMHMEADAEEKGTSPKLLRFLGRPDELSLLARLKVGQLDSLYGLGAALNGVLRTVDLLRTPGALRSTRLGRGSWRQGGKRSPATARKSGRGSRHTFSSKPATHR